MRRLGVVLVAITLVSGACTTTTDVGARRVVAVPAEQPAAETPPPPPATPEPEPDGLVRAASCDSLLETLKAEAAEEAGARGLRGALTLDSGTPARAGSAPAPASAPDRSETNVQEAGVDEPDMVKTAPGTMFVVARGSLHSLVVGGDGPRLAGSLALPNHGGELLLDGDRLLVLSHASWSRGPSRAAYRSATEALVVDVSRPSDMRVVSNVRLEGSLVSARMIDGLARVVLRTWGPDLDFQAPAEHTEETIRAAEEQNRRIVADSAVEDWLPRFEVLDRREELRSSGAQVACTSAYLPPEPEGVGMVTVLSIDPSDPEPRHGTSVVGSGSVVYASQKSMFVAGVTSGVVGLATPDATTTTVHRFDISRPQARYDSSGSVPGTPLSQWSMSEHEGHLRIATTLGQPSGATPTSVSMVTVLRPVAGQLVPVGAVTGLGVGERVYAVRFMGPRGYVVTFRQVDPLYVLDLADPVRPKVLGELKIPGYSAYLHPVGPDLLLGVGQDADEQGRALGAQASLFDVSDPSKPSQLARLELGEGWTRVEHNHRAFLWWEPLRLAGIPLNHEAVVVKVGSTTLEQAARISHPEPPDWKSPIQRTVVMSGSLYTLSHTGILQTDLNTLENGAWTPFPEREAEGSSPTQPPP